MPGQSGYAVGWGTLGLINAGLAQGKHRSGLFWFLVSLLLGPLATFLIVVLPVPGETRASMARGEWVMALVVLGVLVVGALLLYLAVPRFMQPMLSR